MTVLDFAPVVADLLDIGDQIAALEKRREDCVRTLREGVGTGTLADFRAMYGACVTPVVRYTVQPRPIADYVDYCRSRGQWPAKAIIDRNLLVDTARMVLNLAWPGVVAEVDVARLVSDTGTMPHAHALLASPPSAIIPDLLEARILEPSEVETRIDFRRRVLVN